MRWVRRLPSCCGCKRSEVLGNVESGDRSFCGLCVGCRPVLGLASGQTSVQPKDVEFSVVIDLGMVPPAAQL